MAAERLDFRTANTKERPLERRQRGFWRVVARANPPPPALVDAGGPAVSVGVLNRAELARRGVGEAPARLRRR